MPLLLPQIKFKKELALTAEQMREVDRVAVEEINLQVIQMMEIAAFQMARLMRQVFDGLNNKRILVVAGKGNNGGDAIACTRYLYNWGAVSTIVVPPDLNQNANHHLELAKQVGIDMQSKLSTNYEYSAIVDGILGYSVKRDVREPYRDWIDNINSLAVPIFSYDIPSGLDPDNGSIHGVSVKATYTLTLAYPKKGLFVKKARDYVGELYLADIGIPSIVYDLVRQKYPQVEYISPFTKVSLVKIKIDDS